MAGRLGVLRKLVGEEGAWCVFWSVLAVELQDAKAESLRDSSSVSCDCFNVEALGPGEVLGRRTLLSHARGAGVLEGEPVGFELAAVEVAGERCWSWWVDSAVPLPSGVPAASSLMALECRGASCHEVLVGDESGGGACWEMRCRATGAACKCGTVAGRPSSSQQQELGSAVRTMLAAIWRGIGRDSRRPAEEGPWTLGVRLRSG
jgi:hypothetical protein